MTIIQRRKRLAALLASTITITGAIAGTSGTASAYGPVQTSLFKIQKVGYDIGGQTFANGNPTDKAEVQWTQAWFANLVHVSGTLHFEGVSGSCARVKVTSYDENGSVILPVDHSAEECVFSDAHIGRAFGVDGRLGASKVTVALQTRVNAPNAPWGGIGSKTFEYGPVLKTADVLISRIETDFGSGVFTGGTASDSGTLTWKVDDYRPYPVLNGILFMREAKYLCARMRLKYIRSDSGTVVDNAYGTERCQTDDDLHQIPIFLGASNRAYAAVDTVKVMIEVRPDGGTWSTRGQYTVNLP